MKRAFQVSRRTPDAAVPVAVVGYVIRDGIHRAFTITDVQVCTGQTVFWADDNHGCPSPFPAQYLTFDLTHFLTPVAAADFGVQS